MDEIESKQQSDIDDFFKKAREEIERNTKTNEGKKIDEKKSRWPFADDYFDYVWSKDDESND